MALTSHVRGVLSVLQYSPELQPSLPLSRHACGSTGAVSCTPVQKIITPSLRFASMRTWHVRGDVVVSQYVVAAHPVLSSRHA